MIDITEQNQTLDENKRLCQIIEFMQSSGVCMEQDSRFAISCAVQLQLYIP